MIIINCEQGSEQWHELRAGRVTGTRFVKLVAGEKTEAYTGLVMAVASEIITGQADEEGYVSQAMIDGIENEPIAVDEYETLLHVEVKRLGFIIPDEDNEFHEWIGYSPDGMTDGLLEVKCPMLKTHLKYLHHGNLPSEYRHQVQGGLFITGLPYCDFISWARGMKMFIIRVYPDEVMFDFYRTRLRQFIADVNEVIKTYHETIR